MNSLKLIGSSLRWNLEEKFQTRATRTIIATQNTTLFTVVLNTSSRRLFASQGQDYHALCEGGDPKGLGQRLTRHPHNLPLLSSDDRHAIAVVARDFAIDEHV